MKGYYSSYLCATLQIQLIIVIDINMWLLHHLVPWMLCSSHVLPWIHMAENKASLEDWLNFSFINPSKLQRSRIRSGGYYKNRIFQNIRLLKNAKEIVKVCVYCFLHHSWILDCFLPSPLLLIPRVWPRKQSWFL